MEKVSCERQMAETYQQRTEQVSNACPVCKAIGEAGEGLSRSCCRALRTRHWVSESCHSVLRRCFRDSKLIIDFWNPKTASQNPTTGFETP
jgi:hypothetical protein